MRTALRLVPSFAIAPRRRPVVFSIVSTTFSTRGSLSSAFNGLSLTTTPISTVRKMTSVVVEANGKNSIAARPGMGTKRKRRRVSGFRIRMRTPGGRKVLKRRRKKGRHVLCPASVRPQKERFTNKY